MVVVVRGVARRLAGPADGGDPDRRGRRTAGAAADRRGRRRRRWPGCSSAPAGPRWRWRSRPLPLVVFALFGDQRSRPADGRLSSPACRGRRDELGGLGGRPGPPPDAGPRRRRDWPAHRAGGAGSTGWRRRRQACSARAARIAISVRCWRSPSGRWPVRRAPATPTGPRCANVVEPPIDPTVFDSPLSTFRTYTKDRADVVQMTSSGLPAGARLRLAALDDYDGRQFRSATRRDRSSGSAANGRPRPTGPPTTRRRADQGLRAARSCRCPARSSPSTSPARGPAAHRRPAVLRVRGDRPAARRLADRRRLHRGRRGARPSRARSSWPRPAARRPHVPEHRRLPDLLRSAANRYIAGVPRRRRSRSRRSGPAWPATGFFSHGDGAPNPSSRGRARPGPDGRDGHDTPMVGDQEQYAALMALMVRSIGIPARVAVGFVPPLRGAPAAGSPRSSCAAGTSPPGWRCRSRAWLGGVRPDAAGRQAPADRRSIADRAPGRDGRGPAGPAAGAAGHGGRREGRPAARCQRPADPSRPPLGSSMPALLVTMLGWLLLVLALFAVAGRAILASRPAAADAGGAARQPRTGSPGAGRSWWTPRRTPVTGRRPGTPGPRSRGPGRRRRAAAGLARPGRRRGGVLTRADRDPTGPAATGGRWTTAAPNCWAGWLLAALAGPAVAGVDAPGRPPGVAMLGTRGGAEGGFNTGNQETGSGHRKCGCGRIEQRAEGQQSDQCCGQLRHATPDSPSCSSVRWPATG